ncbi:hypothetical protein KSP39_PZI020772 [Platanthera zijinensis]|uniref:Uncharacterized protein n=1 Tax=Platanthera zijinensis TaxID=2320716 RepID=A0AAP0B188_9ASPA
MEKWERSPAAPPLHRRGQNNPSFSSSLLDAIYRSIDESDAGSPNHAVPSAPKKQSNPIDKTWILPPPAPAYHCRRRDSADDRGHRCLFSTSSSSESSSFGGFSSDADSIARPRPIQTRCDRIRSDPPPERKRSSSIRSRLRDLRSLGTPASPGARFSAFLSAIFPGGARNSKKPKFAGGEDESETSPSRSCIGKTPSSSTRAKQRSVSFSPVILPTLEDRLPANALGGKRNNGGDPAPARDPRMMVEELLRRFGIEQEDEDSDCESVSSSDLFELDSLSAIGRFNDELPVYGSTNLSADRTKTRKNIV